MTRRLVLSLDRRSKYGAKKTVLDGITFASTREARRYAELRLLEQAGQIRDLTVQPPYVIEVRGVTVCTYRADFSYWQRDGSAWRLVVEDVKGVKTAVYRLKKKLVRAVHDIDIQEV